MLPYNGEGRELIELKSVTKVYSAPGKQTVQVLDGINFTVRQGEIVALLGSSGSGKSTIMRIMAGLIEPTSGIVLSEGKALHSVNKDVSIVFQNFALYPWLTVYENVEIGLINKNYSKEKKDYEINTALELIGLKGYENSYPKELSGGMKQRVGFARAIVARPKILCMDEPLSALDVLTAEGLRSEIVKLCMDHRTGIQSICIITHNIEEAVFLANKIVILKSNPGHIINQVQNDLPYPRDYKSDRFSQMVEKIYEEITNTILPDTIEKPFDASLDERQSTKGKKSSIEHIPHVAVGEIIGLLGHVIKSDEVCNIFDVASEAGKEFGEIIAIVKAAEMLGFVETPKQNVILTRLGKEFHSADKKQQKNLFQKNLLKMKIFKIIINLISTDEVIQSDKIKEQIAMLLPFDNSEKVLATMMDWLRFSGLVEYDDDVESFVYVVPTDPTPL